MKPVTSVLILIALILAGCSPTTGTSSSSTQPAGPTTTTPSIVSSTAGPTTTAGSTTTTGGASTTSSISPAPGYHVSAPDLSSPEPLPGSGGANGSGCAPGPGDLPDGIWFGYILAKGSTTLQFDLACFYVGEIANQKAIAAGEEPLDFFIANDNPSTRDVPFAADTLVWSITGDPTAGLQQVPISDWPAAEPTYTPCPGQYCSVWLYVNASVVTEVMEQYLP